MGTYQLFSAYRQIIVLVICSIVLLAHSTGALILAWLHDVQVSVRDVEMPLAIAQVVIATSV
jgi:hypothetical protein